MGHVVIAGGSGFLGKALTEYFSKLKKDVIVLTREPSRNRRAKEVYWDGESVGPWCDVLEDADVLINLSGKSVDCRYTEENKERIYASRLNSTRILGHALRQCHRPPAVWLNASSATIYRGSYTKFMDERTGEVGHDFSMDVCKQWEAAFESCHTPDTKKITLRIAIVLSDDGGALAPLQNLVRIGAGGQMADGRQFFSWIHVRDLCRVVDWLIEKRAAGIYNLCSPQPVTNRAFMKTLREAMGMPVGVPLPKLLLKIGAAVIGTETELILKSRKVYPQRLLDEGFVFEFPDLKTALGDLCRRKETTS
jgi:hypothetical protein